MCHRFRLRDCRSQASQNFPRLRLADQKTLTQTLTDIERALPPTDAMLASLKKDLGLRQEAMAERYASQIDRNKSAVVEEFLKKTYSVATCALAHPTCISTNSVAAHWPSV